MEITGEIRTGQAMSRDGAAYRFVRGVTRALPIRARRTTILLPGKQESDPRPVAAIL
jgi:hypothetical protein